MIIINLLTVILVPFVFGRLLLSALTGDEQPEIGFLEVSALSFAIGLGGVTILMYLLSWLNIPLTLLNILATLAGISAILIIFLFKEKSFFIRFKKPKFASLDWQEWLLTGLIFIKIVFVFFSALVKPVIDIDAILYYSIVAKGIFYGQSFFAPYLQTFIASKPPFPYLAQGWTLIGLQQPNDCYLKLFSAILFLCLIIIFYSVLRRSLSRKPSLVFAFFLSTLPLLVYHATTAYADLLITFYFSVAGLYSYLFIKQGQRNHLILALIFCGLTVWAKKAGFILAGIDLFLLFIFLPRPQLKKTIPYLAIFLVLIAPILAGRMIDTFGMLNPTLSFEQPQLSLEEKTSAMIPIVGKKLFLYADWHLTWLLFLAALIFFPKQLAKTGQNFLLAIILLSLLAILGQFATAGSFRWLLDGTLLDRLLMPVVPLTLFFSGQIFLAKLDGTSPAKGSVLAKSVRKT